MVKISFLSSTKLFYKKTLIMYEIKVYIRKDIFERRKKFPLFFFTKEKKFDYSLNNYYQVWEAESDYFKHRENGELDYEGQIKSTTGNTFFGYGQLRETMNNQNDKRIEGYLQLGIVEYNPRDYNHLRALFLLFLSKVGNTYDDYANRELIWAFSRYFIDFQNLKNVLDGFDKNTVVPALLKGIKIFGYCLSMQKQGMLQHFLASRGIAYTVYCPLELRQAYEICCTSSGENKDIKNKTVFDLIANVVTQSKEENANRENINYQLKDSDNFFLNVRNWLNLDNYVFNEYERLSDFFNIFKPELQMLLLKRYFYAVYKSQTVFNQEFIQKIQNNKYDNWRRFYHCMNTPADSVNLGVWLLCDSILTCIATNAESMQSINGCLDIAYKRCNHNHPKVDFGLKRIMPLCDGGAVQNKTQFNGFVLYRYQYELDMSKFTGQAFEAAVIKILEMIAPKIKNSELQVDGYNSEICGLADSITQTPTLDKKFDNAFQSDRIGIIKDKLEEFLPVLELFVNEGGWQLDYSKDTESHEISQNQNLIGINIDSRYIITNQREFKLRLMKWLDCNLLNVSYGSENEVNPIWELSKPVSYYQATVIKTFLKPRRIILSPRKNAFIGCGVLNEKLGITQEYLASKQIQNDNPEIQKLEYEKIVKPIVNKLLTSICSDFPGGSDEFIIDYDEKLIQDLKSKFYMANESTRDAMYYSDLSFNQYNTSFLVANRVGFSRFCAPKTQPNKHHLLQLPYYWCNGVECFKAVLKSQVVKNISSWRQYTILHILEILGFQQVKSDKEGVYEVSKMINSFVAMILWTTSLFSHLRCRECGHIIFPVGSDNLINSISLSVDSQRVNNVGRKYT